jgi:NADP-dependent 3-hydroxy acid dehydrogenase YdfG
MTAAMNLVNAAVVVTGASGGIGEALARVLVARGARVALLARRAELLAALSRELGSERALAVPTDVTKRADVDAAMSAAVAHFGQVDAWVNNAGRGITRQVTELTDDDLDEMITANVKSALYGMQAACRHFEARGTGAIVNVSSMLGRVPFAAQRSAYSASKHALNSLTANLRMELRARGSKVVVASVHPGVVATEFGVNALHGGMDSSHFPGAQTATDVATIIADTLSNEAVDVYTRPEGRSVVARYYAAEDLSAVEGAPPFAMPAPRATT